MRHVSLAAMAMALATCLRAESTVPTLPKSALQSSYAGGSIDGVSFAASASTSGKCVNIGTATCSVFLGIEQLATAPLGRSVQVSCAPIAR